jgi:CDP-4-dehydro-6-deoxyglucose reductase
MYQIRLKNGKLFTCEASTTIFDAAKSAGITLEHSCLYARCRSCIVRISEGTTRDKSDDLVLTSAEKDDNWTLSCNAIPTSDLYLDIEDLGDIRLFDKIIVPAKVQALRKLNEDVLEVILRLPPNANFGFNSGQYVNIIKGQLKRSYSVANAFQESGMLTFFIRRYENGLMSNYWLNEAKENDLLRLEGPLGTFFLRDTQKNNVVFLATGTGIAPVKAILEAVILEQHKYQEKTFWIFFGSRFLEDEFWNPTQLEMPNVKYIRAISRQKIISDSTIFNGYVQDALLNYQIDLTDTQVYACGSTEMIRAARNVCFENGVSDNDFFSDAFLCSN